jgi:hypothetical protein
LLIGRQQSRRGLIPALQPVAPIGSAQGLAG